ncbi:MAG: hypothetical protein ACI9OJ_002065 [Myxococcota bacterium]|jgi:hypothetical protein
MSRLEVEWIDPEAEQGPLFRVGRDVYERERAGGRVIWLRAHESYPARVALPVARAFDDCARRWGAPAVFIIDPNLKKPPAARFLFEWSRATAASGSVEESFMRTGNRLSQLMGKLVLRMFTDGTMSFRAINGTDAMNAHLDTLDLSCPQPGFVVRDTEALVLRGESPPSLMRSLLRRARRRLGGGPDKP